MSLPTLLREIGQFSDARTAARALELVYIGIDGPARPAVYEVMTALGTRSGQSAAAIPSSIAAAVDGLLGHAGLESTHFLSPEVPDRLQALLREIAAPRVLVSRPPIARPAARREELDPSIREDVIWSWRQFDRRLREFQRERVKVPDEYRENPEQQYVDSLTVALEARVSQRVGAGRTANAQVQKVLAAGRRLFRVRGQLLNPKPKPTAPAPVLPTERFRELRDIFQIPISDETAVTVEDALGRLQKPPVGTPVPETNWSSLMGSVRRIIPKASESVQELVAHFWEYRSHPHPPGHYGFVLKVARLARGLSVQQMGARGFSRNMIGALESGRMLRGRRDFRRVVLMYGVPYGPIADAYVRTVYPHLDLGRLKFYQSPVFIDQREVKKLASYKEDSPSAGEKVTLARLERDWSAEELVAATQWEASHLSELENNHSYPEVAQIVVLCKILGIQLDEFLSLLQQTYFPELEHPRLEREPIHIIRGERGGDPQKLEMYAAEPGTIGEEVFFRRKRKYWSLDELSEKTGIAQRRLVDLEYNRRSPTGSELATLAQALGVWVGMLNDRVGRTTFTPVARSNWRLVGTEEGIQLDRIVRRPRPSDFRRMVENLGVAAHDLAKALNAKFSPEIDLIRYRSCTGRPIYISDRADIERLNYYATLAYQSLGEVLFFGRKDLVRNWTTGEASGHLHISKGDIRSLEMNRERPGDMLLGRVAIAYGLPLQFLEERRAATQFSDGK